MTLKKTDIIEKLKAIKYPGFSRDIVSFGMIKDISISNNSITIILNQTTNDTKILDEIKENITLSLDTKNVNLKISYESTGTIQNDTSNKINKIKNIIAVASGKGGVGKSTISINLALELSKKYKVGLLDLDIYGPSLPTLIGEKTVPKIKEGNLLVPIKKFNMKFMSFGFLNSNDDPAVWRGPMVSKLTQQFFDNVDWGELDFLILDLPPGTGDIQLTLVQKIALTGAIIITTPQDLAHIDVKKGSDMFSKVSTPVLGVIENMSGYNLKGKITNYENLSNSKIIIKDIIEPIEINDNGEFETNIQIFKGDSGDKESRRLSIPLLGTIPLDPSISIFSDKGIPAILDDESGQIKIIFQEISDKLSSLVKLKKLD